MHSYYNTFKYKFSSNVTNNFDLHGYFGPIYGDIVSGYVDIQYIETEELAREINQIIDE